MPKTIAATKYLLAAFLLLACLQGTLSADQHFVIGYFWHSRYTDAAKQIMARAYQHCGILVDFEFLPGERSLLLADTGEVDASLFRSEGVTEKYSNLVMVPVHLFVAQPTVFRRTGQTLECPVRSWDDLAPYRLAFRRGAMEVEKHAKRLQMIYFVAESDEKAFQMLHEGRVDIVVTDYINGLGTLKKTGLQGIEPENPPFDSHRLYHYVNRRHRGLVDCLARELRRMADSGEIGRILEESAP